MLTAAPNDYTAIDSDVITFLANQTSVTATVTIVNDVIAEDDEIFYLMLTTDIPRGVIADDRETIITITDTDSKSVCILYHVGHKHLIYTD